MLGSLETGRHDEILLSVVAHNARRRAQRARAARNRRLARLTSRLAIIAAVGLGVYALVVYALVSVSGGHGGGAASATHQPVAAEAAPAVAKAPARPKAVSARKASTPAPPHRHAAKTVAHKKTAAHAPVTASIASVPRTKTKTAKHHATVTTTAKKKPTVKASSAAQGVVLAEADASQGTRASSLEATIPDPTVATLTIAATRGSAFVEVRLKTASGPLLTKGTVPKGETITFSNKLMWVKVYSPGRLDLSVNGKPWRPTGSTVVATLSPAGVQQ